MSAAEWLDEIEARAAAATEGPWVRVVSADGEVSWVEVTNRVTICETYAPVPHVDAEFIAHARADVPAMAKALRDVLREHSVSRETFRYGVSLPPVLVCDACNHQAPCPTRRAIEAARGA